MKNLTTKIILLGFMLFCGNILLAQQQKISGKVTEENGTPIPGVAIKAKGTTEGTTTDSKGTFSLALPNGVKILTFSFVGMKTTDVEIGNRNSLTVTLLPDVKDLDEVVVVGYGTQRKTDITGSTVSVSEKALREVPVANLTQALTGRAAGVDISRTSTRPGQAGQIRIRGDRSLTGSNDPLLVVDGIPFGGNINDLNSDDIAGVEILKDASATAIYGSRGSSGVVLITTKKGTQAGKPVITFNSYYGVSQINKQYPMMNAQEFAQYRKDADYSGGNTADEIVGIANGTNTDWQSLVYQKGIMTSNQLSLSGGDAKTQYGLGIGYFQEKGVFNFMSLDRYNIRASIDQKIGNRIKIGLNTLNNLSYNNGQDLNPMLNVLRMSPIQSPYLADGSFNYIPGIGSQDGNINPLLLNNSKDIMKNTQRRFRTFNSLYGEVEIINGLKYRVNVGLDFSQQNTGSFNGAGSFFSGGYTDQQGTLNPLSSNANVTNGEAWSYVIENIVSYEKTIKEKHRINFTGLYSNQVSQSSSSSFNSSAIPFNYIQEYNFLQAGSVTVNVNNNGYVKQGLSSFMGRLNYAYDNRFLVTATIRRDGTSVLSPGSQWFTYPAVALGWNISNEKFMSKVDFVSNLKLRAGWGLTSNQGIAPYSTLGGLTTNSYNYGSTNVTGYFVTNLPNPNLKWESTSNNNIGVDFGLFRNRITGSLDIYTQRTKDILVNKSLPISNGASSFVTNAAETKGNGVELSLSSINVDSKSNGFTWATDFNFSVNRNEIVQLADPNLKQDIGNGWFVGQPLTVIYDFKKIGVWQTNEAGDATSFNSKPGRIKIEDLNKDGKIDANDRSVLGSFQPDWTGGLTNRIGYKNFDLSFVMFARWGGKVVNGLFQSTSGGGPFGFFGQGRTNVLKYNYWTPTNPTNDFPQPDGRTNNADYYSTLGYLDGTFVKMRSINLGYMFPTKICEKIKVQSLRVYLTAQNPFIIYSPLVRDGYGIDPEGTGFGNVIGSQGGATAIPGRAITINADSPSTSAWILGLNLKF